MENGGQKTGATSVKLKNGGDFVTSDRETGYEVIFRLNTKVWISFPRNIILISAGREIDHDLYHT